jgi:hypothetical protein
MVPSVRRLDTPIVIAERALASKGRDVTVEQTDIAVELDKLLVTSINAG